MKGGYPHEISVAIGYWPSCGQASVQWLQWFCQVTFEYVKHSVNLVTVVGGCLLAQHQVSCVRSFDTCIRILTSLSMPFLCTQCCSLIFQCCSFILYVVEDPGMLGVPRSCTLHNPMSLRPMIVEAWRDEPSVVCCSKIL